MFTYANACTHYQKYVLNNKTFVGNGTRIENINRLIRGNDVTCIEQLRTNRRTFGILCELLRTTEKLKELRDVMFEEQVAILFLYIISHNFKNIVTKHFFRRSGETVSRHFNAVLNVVLRLEGILLRAPEPILDNCPDDRWKWFKVCDFFSYFT